MRLYPAAPAPQPGQMIASYAIEALDWEYSTLQQPSGTRWALKDIHVVMAGAVRSLWSPWLLLIALPTV